MQFKLLPCWTLKIELREKRCNRVEVKRQLKNLFVKYEITEMLIIITMILNAKYPIQNHLYFTYFSMEQLFYLAPDFVIPLQ